MGIQTHHLLLSSFIHTQNRGSQVVRLILKGSNFLSNNYNTRPSLSVDTIIMQKKKEESSLDVVSKMTCYFQTSK